MSVCAQVEINNDGNVVYDSDERDIVYAMFHNECVGMAHITVNKNSNSSEVYLTVLGKEEMNRKQISFQLWQASTGKIFGLTPSREVLFAHGFVYGCGNNEPIILSTNGSERQQIELASGWNWTSINLDLHGTGSAFASSMTAAQPWTNGDIIKNPNTRQFSTFDEASDAFAGTLQNLHYSQMYMIYTAQGNTMRITGDILPEDSMKIRVRGDGQWSVMPCLFEQRMTITEAFADYYQDATPGDLIKGHNRFAVFSSDKNWVGDLTALQPGEGYLFRRLGKGAIEIAFHKPEITMMPKRVSGERLAVSGFDNPKAATNSTMIARIEGVDVSSSRDLEVFVNDELCAVATPIDSLYFITIQSDQVGELRFEMNGERLAVSGERISYEADAHHGSLKAPVILQPVENERPYKIIEENHVIIIRNGERYDVTGKKL